MNKYSLLSIFALTCALAGCDKGDAAEQAPTKSAAAAPATNKAADKPTAAAADAAPSCDVVVDKIASFNPGSGAAERKLWNKMCAEMSGPVRTCVSKASDMDGMKSCVKNKKLKD